MKNSNYNSFNLFRSLLKASCPVISFFLYDSPKFDRSSFFFLSFFPFFLFILIRDRRKLTFYFVADRRIDFRELVRDLFKLYKTRIWMCSTTAPAAGPRVANPK